MRKLRMLLLYLSKLISAGLWNTCGTKSWRYTDLVNTPANQWKHHFYMPKMIQRTSNRMGPFLPKTFAWPSSDWSVRFISNSWIPAQTGSGLFLHKHMAEIFQAHKKQVNFPFSDKRARYISRNSNTNSSLILALIYMQPWRYIYKKQLLGTQNPKLHHC